MKKPKKVKAIIFVFIFLLILIGVVIGFFIIGGDNNPIKSIINNFTNNNEINDNYNGIYSYIEDLNGTKFIYSGCSLNAINHYVLIVNDEYYAFKSSCMGTYPVGDGKVEELDIQTTADKSSFYLVYKDREYKKDNRVNSIETRNDIATRLKEIDVNNYELILKETQFEGNYYTITARINGISNNLVFGLDRLEDGTFDIGIYNGGRGENLLLYKYNVKDFSNLPKLYPYGRNVVFIEPNMSEDGTKLAYGFKSVSTTGITYDINNVLPIKVDNVVLDNNNSIYISYDTSRKIFTLLIGYNENMCVENSDSSNIAYYEFRINYEYSKNSFSVPEFVKYGRENEGCSYVNKIMGR